ncbi:MAG: hypothetical protein J6Z06_03605 [Lachnospiraceae bacterium]|nr:hypothetical protein [Lachnospiraceae bacterium]
MAVMATVFAGCSKKAGNVKQGLFQVTLTVPAEYVDDSTQEELDEAAEEAGYKSATLNDDGSVTYVMPKAQYKELMVQTRESYDESLSQMIESWDYPNFTNVEHNDDYTGFTITTKSTKMGASEYSSVAPLYDYGWIYGMLSGKEVENIHIEFINADSGEMIGVSDSKDQ